MLTTNIPDPLNNKNNKNNNKNVKKKIKLKVVSKLTPVKTEINTDATPTATHTATEAETATEAVAVAVAVAVAAVVPTATPTPLCCKNCSAMFKRKALYDRHILYCNTLAAMRSTGRASKTDYVIETAEDDAVVPSQRELFVLLQELTLKYTRLQQDVAEIKKYTAKLKPNKKAAIEDALNEQQLQATPRITFKRWLDEVMPMHVRRADLEEVFASDLITGMTAAFSRGILGGESDSVRPNPPVCAYADQRPITFYVYELPEGAPPTAAGIWRAMDSREFQTVYNAVNKALMAEFLEWQNENMRPVGESGGGGGLYSEEFSNKYTKYADKMMGGALSTDKLVARFKTALHKAIGIQSGA